MWKFEEKIHYKFYHTNKYILLYLRSCIKSIFWASLNAHCIKDSLGDLISLGERLGRGWKWNPYVTLQHSLLSGLSASALSSGYFKKKVRLAPKENREYFFRAEQGFFRLKGREITLPCSYRSTCFVIYYSKCENFHL